VSIFTQSAKVQQTFQTTKEKEGKKSGTPLFGRPALTILNPSILIFNFSSLIFNLLKRAVAHAARGGDSGQCCRQCCDDYTHNDLPHILLFIHNIQFFKFFNP